MQSRISCFNKTIFKKNILHFWPVWLGYTLFLTFMMPFRILVTTTNPANAKAAGVENLASNNLFAFADALDDSLNASWVFAVALICAMAVFHYMYFQKSINMIHSLPVNRTQLYVTNYVSGLLFLMVPQCLTFLVTSFVCLIKDITDLKFLLYWFLMQLGMGLFAYSMAVVIGMLTGQLIVVPIFFLIANFLYMGIKVIVRMMMTQLTYGMLTMRLYEIRINSILSPLYYLIKTARIQVEYEGASQDGFLMVTGGYTVAVYAAAGILLALLGFFIYKKRRLETVGDFITLEWLKPIFRWGTTLLFSGVAVSVIVQTVQRTLHTDNMILILIGVVCVGVVFFFISQMFVEKSFRVFSKKRFLECAGVQLLLVVIVLGVKLDFMGLENKMPETSEIEKACLYLDFTAEERTGAGIEEVKKIHKQILDSKKEFQEEYYKDMEYNYQSVGIKYFCKDGSTLERHYYIPSSKKYLEDENSVLNKVLNKQYSYESYMSYLFGYNYETTKPMSVMIELYNVQSKTFETVNVESGYVDQFFEAVKQDMKEGGLTQNPYIQYEENYYYNSLTIEYYNPDGIASNEEGWYQKEVQPENGWNSSNSYIQFSKDCKNILGVLKETGLLDENHKLLTCKEAEMLE